MLMYFFEGFSLNLTLCMIKLRVLMLCFSYFTDNSIISHTHTHIYIHRWEYLCIIPKIKLWARATLPCPRL
jgi:hypothetical protein